MHAVGGRTVVNFAQEFVGFFYEARIEQIWSAVASGADSRADIATGRSWATTGLTLGVMMIGGPLRTEQAAKLAGEKALRDFLERLTEETERQ